MSTENDKIRVAQILTESLVNGEGVRLVVAFQGCNIGCPGCHNPELHSTDGGYLTTVDEILSHVTELTNGITISGGEPTMQPSQAYQLLAAAKRRGLRTLMYTGLTKEQWESHPWFSLIMPVLDQIKIGPYQEENRALNIPYMGSTNQAIYKIENGEFVEC